MSAQEIAGALGSVFDPELGIDIVSMGLIYGIVDEPDRVVVVMTTTFDGCPMSQAIEQAVYRTLEAARPQSNLAVEMTHEPAWDPQMLTLGARRWLGLA